MCGVVAIFNYREGKGSVDPGELQRIRDAMSLRGPDGVGEWYSEDGRVGLGHRRLAIIDLSEKAAQPMENREGTLVVSFNGEIYNYRELRSDLQKRGRVFQSHSDTEVLLHLYQEKGREMVHDLRGMFAFALWDGREKGLLLARDSYGIKPLYYADDGRTIRAASQVKALLAGGQVSRRVESAGAAGFFLTGTVPEPYTLYQEIRALPAGHLIWVNRLGISPPKQYFSIPQIFTEAERNPQPLTPVETQAAIREALLDSVKHHFVADVAVGIFLSGGIDSGTLVALARESKVNNLQTITLTFEEFRGEATDEAPLAEEVARAYGTTHHTHCLSLTEFKKDLLGIFKAMDQPTIDGINTYSVSKVAAQRGLKVALSGLGGDELFGGYPSFREVPRMVRLLAVPSRLPFAGDAFRRLQEIFVPWGNPKLSGLVKYGGTYPGAYLLRRGLFLPWELPQVMEEEMAVEGLKRLEPLSYIKAAMEPEPQNSFARVAALESSLYLRNQLLRDTDWAGMAHSLEIRTPLVDSFLIKKLLPPAMNRSRFWGKTLLAQAAEPPLPDGIRQRRKTGFNTPVNQWLMAAGELDGWRRIPLLAKTHCPWARRWGFVVYNHYIHEN